MPLASLALIAVTILLSTFISGVFGMAGGMVLLGVLLVYFDVATAMVMFSIIQLFGNGMRAFQWRQYVLWPIFWRYVVGAAIAFAAMRSSPSCRNSRHPDLQPRPARRLFRLAVGDFRLDLWLCLPAIALAIAGTSFAPWVIERMTDHGFRQGTRAIIFAISAVYLVRAAWLTFGG